ncbi:MAG: patatin-like phospholipase family protein [Polyangiales bacterium]
MKRALVLGGGGLIGVAWESGIAVGLSEQGVDPRSVDAIVGTSAGAIVGAQLAAGRLPSGPAAAATSLGPDERPLIDPGRLDLAVLGKVFTLWGAMKETTEQQAAEIGKLAASVQREAESDFVAQLASSVGVAEWPALRLLIAAVSTDTGRRRIFEREGGAELPRAVAASSAVPGMFPSVSIDGALYMDGQVHSSTNADVLVPHRPAQVLIAMPTNGVTARGIGRHAERMLELELRALRAAGCAVSVRTPTAADGPRLGGNLMDPTRVPDAYAVGLETGRAWAAELR